MHKSNEPEFDDRLMQDLQEVRIAAQHLVEQMRRDLVRHRYWLEVEGQNKEFAPRETSHYYHSDISLGPEAATAVTEFRRVADVFVDAWNYILDSCLANYPPGSVSDLRLLYRTERCFALAIDLDTACDLIEVSLWDRVESFIPSLEKLQQEIHKVIEEDCSSISDEECEIVLFRRYCRTNSHLISWYREIRERLSKKQRPIFQLLWERKSKDALAVRSEELYDLVDGEGKDEAVRKAMSRIEESLILSGSLFLIEKDKKPVSYRLVPTENFKTGLVYKDRKYARAIFKQAVEEYGRKSTSNVGL